MSLDLDGQNATLVQNVHIIQVSVLISRIIGLLYMGEYAKDAKNKKKKFKTAFQITIIPR